jgi:hypothetical protein
MMATPDVVGDNAAQSVGKGLSLNSEDGAHDSGPGRK